MVSSKDVSVVVQGAIDKELTLKCLQSVRKYLPDAEVILSTWKGSDVSNLNGLYDTLVLNKDPGGYCHDFDVDGQFYAVNNCNRQLVSTVAGCNKATKKYILKLRTDLHLTSTDFLNYWDMFSRRNKKFSFFKHRVLNCSLYAREFSCERGYPLAFHPSDFWFFGLSEDIKDYFCDCPLQTREEGEAWVSKFPNRLPYMRPSWRFPPEQFYCVNWAKKHFSDIEYYDGSDWNPKNTELSNNILYNNFVFLGVRQSGIHSEKHNWAEEHEKNIRGLITFEHFQKQYQKYCDLSFVTQTCYEEKFIPNLIDNNLVITWKEKLKVNRYVDKLKKHYCNFINPLKVVMRKVHKFSEWLTEPFSMLYYAVKILIRIVVRFNRLF